MPNYAFKPIAGQSLRSNQSIVPQRLNAALGLSVSLFQCCGTYEMNSTIDLVHDWLNDNVRVYKVVPLKEIEIDVERQTLSACYICGNKVIDVVAWNHNMSLDVLVMTGADGKVENAFVGTCDSKEQLIDRLIKGFQCAVQLC